MKHEKDSDRVAVIYIEDEQGRVMMGKRNDSGKWANPGGHIEKGEDPYQGAVRELWEETRLVPKSIKMRAVKWLQDKNMLLYVFDVRCESYNSDASKDPDKECNSWEFVDLIDIVDELDVPLEYNAVVRYHLRDVEI